MADDDIDVRLARLEEQVRAQKAANDEAIAALRDELRGIKRNGWGVVLVVLTYVLTKLLDNLQFNGGGP